jgi:hypothetical protein
MMMMMMMIVVMILMLIVMSKYWKGGNEGRRRTFQSSATSPACPFLLPSPLSLQSSGAKTEASSQEEKVYLYI